MSILTFGAKMKGLTTPSEVAAALSEFVPNEVRYKDICFLCIGTDRSTGDSLGPLVGSRLEKKLKNRVVGTLYSPAHAMNLEEQAQNLQGRYVIAIDASLGQVSAVGTVAVKRGGIKPGAGVKKDLGTYGEIGIEAIVNVGGFMEYFVLQNTRLSLIMSLAEIISEGVLQFLKSRKPIKINREVIK